MLKKSAVLVLVALLAAPIGYRFWRPPAPNAVFTTLNGDKLAVADWRGQPALVTFWASDCPTCLKEIPPLKNLYQRYAPRGLHMVAVAMAYDLPSRVVSLATSMALPYPVALDPLGDHARAFGDIAWTPTTLLFGPDGRLLWRIVGDFDPAILAQRIEPLLAEN